MRHESARNSISSRWPVVASRMAPKAFRPSNMPCSLWPQVAQAGSLEFKKRDFVVEAAAVAGERDARANDAVARDDDAYLVPPDGAADSLRPCHAILGTKAR